MDRSPAFLDGPYLNCQARQPPWRITWPRAKNAAIEKPKNPRPSNLSRRPQARHLLLCQVAQPEGNPPSARDRDGSNRLDHALKTQIGPSRGHLSRRRGPPIVVRTEGRLASRIGCMDCLSPDDALKVCHHGRTHHVASRGVPKP